MEETRRTWPTIATKKGSQGLPETESTSTGAVLVCTRTSVYILWLFTWWFCRNPNSGSRYISDSFVCSWDQVLEWSCHLLKQNQKRVHLNKMNFKCLWNMGGRWVTSNYIFLLFCVSANSCKCSCIYVEGVYAHVYMHMWRSKVNLRSCALGLVRLGFCDTVSHWELDLPDWACLAVQGTQRYFYFCYPSSGIIIVSPHPVFFFLPSCQKQNTGRPSGLYGSYLTEISLQLPLSSSFSFIHFIVLEIESRTQCRLSNSTSEFPCSLPILSYIHESNLKE